MVAELPTGLRLAVTLPVRRRGVPGPGPSRPLPWSIVHPRAPRRVAALVITSLVAVAACGDDDDQSAPPDAPVASTATATVPASTAAATTVAPTAAPTVPPAPLPAMAQLDTVSAGLVPIPGTEQLKLLTSVALRPSDGSLYFGLQDGKVARLGADGLIETVLDISAVTSPYENGSERGLLGLGISPADERLFVYFTDPNTDSHLYSYAIDAAGRPDPASALDVLFVDQPGLGHKGGGVAFLPDGTLLLSLGDGGGSNGRDAQDYTKLLGGIVRIRPKVGAPGYDVPPDNPYVGNTEGRLPEIWAKGIRNPWGFSIDAPTGDLWFGDVGNESQEEVNRVAATTPGLNFGWYFIEGTQVNHDGAPPDAVGPVFAYGHGDLGVCVIGGSVYRGAAIPALNGAYVFADLTGSIYALSADGQANRIGGHSNVISGWGVDAAGELIMLSLRDGAFRLAPA